MALPHSKSKIVDYIRRLNKEKKIVNACTSYSITRKQSETPEEYLLKSEYRQLLQAAFCMISSDYQEVLQKKYIEELAVKQIAKNMNKSEKSVESLLYRGRKELIQSIEKLAKERIIRFFGGLTI